MRASRAEQSSGGERGGRSRGFCEAAAGILWIALPAATHLALTELGRTLARTLGRSPVDSETVGALCVIAARWRANASLYAADSSLSVSALCLICYDLLSFIYILLYAARETHRETISYS